MGKGSGQAQRQKRGRHRRLAQIFLGRTEDGERTGRTGSPLAAMTEAERTAPQEMAQGGTRTAAPGGTARQTAGAASLRMNPREAAVRCPPEAATIQIRGQRIKSFRSPSAESRWALTVRTTPWPGWLTIKGQTMQDSILKGSSEMKRGTWSPAILIRTILEGARTEGQSGITRERAASLWCRKGRRRWNWR